MDIMQDDDIIAMSYVKTTQPWCNLKECFFQEKGGKVAARFLASTVQSLIMWGFFSFGYLFVYDPIQIHQGTILLRVI